MLKHENQQAWQMELVHDEIRRIDHNCFRAHALQEYKVHRLLNLTTGSIM